MLGHAKAAMPSRMPARPRSRRTHHRSTIAATISVQPPPWGAERGGPSATTHLAHPSAPPRTGPSRLLGPLLLRGPLLRCLALGSPLAGQDLDPLRLRARRPRHLDGQDAV